MKRLNLAIVVAIPLLGMVQRATAQVTLPEVRIVASKYKYLNAADNEEMSQPVRMLERQVASYDVRKSDFYSDEYDGYFVSFYIPDGKILAAYDGEGKLLRTAEKFKNTKLPQAVREAILKRFPNWGIAQDIYQVYYYDDMENANKVFKVLLENGNQRLKVKLNEKGEFI